MTIRREFAKLFYELERYQSVVDAYVGPSRIHADLQACMNEIDGFVKDAKFLLDHLMRNYEDSSLEKYAETIRKLSADFSSYKDIAIQRLLNYNPENQNSFNEITIAHEDEMTLFYSQLKNLNLNESFAGHKKIRFDLELKAKMINKTSHVSRPIIKSHSAYPDQVEKRSSILYEAIRSVQEQTIAAMSEEFNVMDDRRRELCDEYLEAMRDGLKNHHVDVGDGMGIRDIYQLYRDNNIAHPVKARVLKFEYDRIQKSLEAKSGELDALKNEHRRFLLDNMRLRIEQPPALEMMEFEFCLDSSGRPGLK